MIKSLSTALAAWLFACATTPVAAEGLTERAADGRRQLAEADLEAAYRLLQENHPGAAAELGDDKFREALSRAYAVALERAARIDSYNGYTAVLAGFATSFGDEHIWTNTKLRGTQYRWTGLVTARRGENWIVAVQDKEAGEPDLVGARLVSCGGQDAATFARESLAFRLSAPIEAQYVAHGGFMLIDDGNPFLARPTNCVFEKDGGLVTMELAWRPVPTPKLAQSLQSATRSETAGFGIRWTGDSVWVAMERLSPDAQAVLDAFEERREELLGASSIVVDVRGNGGGNSLFGRKLAGLIYGERFVSANLRANGVCAAVWRASAGNAEHLRQLAATDPNADTAKYYSAIAERMMIAVAAGEAFETPLPDCGAGQTASGLPVPDGPVADYQGRVILITDHACFSSCLLMTQDFRQLGALHVGTETNAATRYMEVREIELPSGLSTFSTLQKVQLGGQTNIGPFTPRIVAPNGTGDTAELERWIAGLK